MVKIKGMAGLLIKCLYLDAAMTLGILPLRYPLPADSVFFHTDMASASDTCKNGVKFAKILSLCCHFV